MTCLQGVSNDPVSELHARTGSVLILYRYLGLNRYIWNINRASCSVMVMVMAYSGWVLAAFWLSYDMFWLGNGMFWLCSGIFWLSCDMFWLSDGMFWLCSDWVVICCDGMFWFFSGMFWLSCDMFWLSNGMPELVRYGMVKLYLIIPHQ